MTVLLVLLMLIIFLTADHFVQRARQRALAVARAAPLFRPLFSLPGGVRLATNHTWVRPESDGTVTVGLDEFLTRLLGDVRNVVLPGPEDAVTPATAEIRVIKAPQSLELAAPVPGRVVRVNRDVVRNPALLRSDPYGSGWLLNVQPDPGHRGGDTPFLVSQPVEWLKEQTDRARDFFSNLSPTALPATMLDGGAPADGLLGHYDEQVWREFTLSFAVLHTPRQNDDRRSEEAHSC